MESSNCGHCDNRLLKEIDHSGCLASCSFHILNDGDLQKPSHALSETAKGLLKSIVVKIACMDDITPIIRLSARGCSDHYYLTGLLQLIKV